MSSTPIPVIGRPVIFYPPQPMERSNAIGHLTRSRVPVQTVKKTSTTLSHADTVIRSPPVHNAGLDSVLHFGYRTIVPIPRCISLHSVMTANANTRIPLTAGFMRKRSPALHAAPILNCGIQEGEIVARSEGALQSASDIVREGKILAVKSLGGFQLWVNAESAEAVQRLRRRKHRPTKPFAVLFPSLSYVEQHCLTTLDETDILTSPAAPIVLIRKRKGSTLAWEVSPSVIPM